MIEVLGAVAVLAVVVIGLLIIVQVISPIDVLGVVGRVLIMLLVAVLAFYAMKTLWTSLLVPWFSAGLAAFKASLFWFALTLVALIALLIAGRFIFKWLGRHFSLRLGSQKGHTYDHDHY